MKKSPRIFPKRKQIKASDPVMPMMGAKILPKKMGLVKKYTKVKFSLFIFGLVSKTITVNIEFNLDLRIKGIKIIPLFFFGFFIIFISYS